jgi:hypothetical protein
MRKNEHRAMIRTIVRRLKPMKRKQFILDGGCAQPACSALADNCDLSRGAGTSSLGGRRSAAYELPIRTAGGGNWRHHFS